MRTRIIRHGLIALLLSVVSVATVAVSAGELRPLKNLAPASAFMLRDLDGKLTSFTDFEGKVVLLNFWATWCATCRKEMPAMERLYRSLRADGFEVVAISVDQVSTEKVKAFAEELKITFPVLHDRDSIISNLYSNPGVPVSYLIDRQGRIVYRVLGEYDWFSPEARAAVKTLLQGTRKNSEG
jgi:peroxiredoxin